MSMEDLLNSLVLKLLYYTKNTKEFLSKDVKKIILSLILRNKEIFLFFQLLFIIGK